jgi:type III restriction enzyme
MKKSIIKYDVQLPHIEGHTPDQKPDSFLSKDGKETSIRTGRRPSKILLVDSLRKDVDKWRDDGYPGISETTQELLNFWFEQDHLMNGERFRYYFGQREAIETLIFLVENKGFKDLGPVIKAYSHTFSEWFGKAESHSDNLSLLDSLIFPIFIFILPIQRAVENF